MLGRHVRLMFGAQRWSFNQVLLACNVLDVPLVQDHDDWVQEQYRTRLTNLYARLVQRVYKPKDRQAVRNFRTGLVERLGLLREVEATDQRDLIYSLLSLISAREATIIGVDYTIPFSQVCAKATYASIHTRNDHAILRATEGMGTSRRKLQRFPSWVVDFSSSVALTNNVDFYDDGVQIGGFQLSVDATFPPAQLDDNLSQLTFSAVNCGKVVDVRPLSRRWVINDLLYWIEDAVAAHYRKSCTPASQKPLNHALHARQTATRYSRTRQDSTPVPVHAHAAFVALALALQERARPELTLHSRALNDAFSYWGDLTRVISASQRATCIAQYKRTFRTSVTLGGLSLFALGNGLVGLAPAGVAVGDIVVAAPCADDKTSPFLLLRQRQGASGNTGFRGMVYVHGCMHRMFCEGWRDLDGMGEEFVIP